MHNLIRYAASHLRQLLLAGILLLPTLAAGSGHLVTLWQADGAHNRIYLLGSVHLLRKSDHPLPAAIYRAYEDSGTLIMELDMDDIDPLATQALINELGMISDGSELRDLMGPRLYAKAEEHAQRVNIPLAMLASTEPWFAALTVENLLLMRIGFNPVYGLEMHLSQRARADEKEVLGLETERQQMEILDNLTLEAQRNLLLQSLEEGAELEAVMNEMIAAWRHGDTEYLEQYLLSGLQESHELFDALVADRNRAWAEQIDKLLAEKENYLIIVGALHLVGDISVPALLEERGYTLTQLGDVN